MIISPDRKGEIHGLLGNYDGIRVWIDNKKVLDDWKDHAAKTYKIKTDFKDGLHTFTVEYYEHFGISTLSFQ
jgi:hypothetical protein